MMHTCTVTDMLSDSHLFKQCTAMVLKEGTCKNLLLRGTCSGRLYIGLHCEINPVLPPFHCIRYLYHIIIMHND